MSLIINDTAPRRQYTAEAGQTLFTVPFEFFTNGDLDVWQNEALLPAPAYTVVGAGVTGGGSVTLLTGAAQGDIVTVVRNMDIERITDFPPSGPFNIAALNAELDAIVAMIQQLDVKLEQRALMLSVWDTPGDLFDLPPMPGRAQSILGFDGDGQPIPVLPSEFGVAAVAQRLEVIATTGQTAFQMNAAFSPQYLGVYVNGVRLSQEEYNASDGLQVVLDEPCVASDVVLLEGFLGSGAASDANAVAFLQAGTGAIPRNAQDKMRERVTPQDFGAVGDGVTDDGPSFQVALNAHRVVTVPAGTYVINTPVTIPPGGALTSEFRGAATITTNSNTTTIICGTGGNVRISGLDFLHNGDGRIIDATHDDSMIIEDCAFYGSLAGATASLIFCSGSFSDFRRNIVTNGRTAPYAFVLDRTGTTLDIESHIEQCRFGGPGMAMWIGSSDNSARPEGFYLTNTCFFGTNTNLVIEQVLSMTISNNIFDQGGLRNLILKPTGNGIDALMVSNNYFATPNQLTNGIALEHDNTNPVGLRHVSVVGNYFTFCGIGARFRTGAMGLSLVGNSFTACGSQGIMADQAQKVAIVGNTFSSMAPAPNITLIDGAAGGPFTIDNNCFDAAASVVLTKTSAAKFVIGNGNTGGLVMTGTYNPSFIAVANIDSVSGYPVRYFQVRNMVTVFGWFDVDPTAAPALTKVGITLPVSSNLTALEQLSGTASSVDQGVSGVVWADAANDRAEVSFKSSISTIHGWVFHFSYEVI